MMHSKKLTDAAELMTQLSESGILSEEHTKALNLLLRCSNDVPNLIVGIIGSTREAMDAVGVATNLQRYLGLK